MRQAKSAIEHERDSVQAALDAYTVMADRLQQDPNTPAKEELQRNAQINVERTVEYLDEAESCLSKLIQLRETLECSKTNVVNDIDLNETMERLRTDVLNNTNTHPPVTNLAPIPIPKFSGDIREWEAFWGAFNHNVHSRKMDDLQKMTYSLEALQGKANEGVKHYHLSKDNYLIVVQHLIGKYDNKQALIRHLLKELRATEAKTRGLEDQEELCEALYSIVTQLQEKAEFIDTQVLQLMLLEKFTKEIQRYARQKIRQRPEGKKTEELLKDIKEYIKEELELHNEDEKRPTSKTESRNQHEKASTIRSYTCFYCNKAGQIPNDCTKVKTQPERVQIIKTRNLCYNCGSSSHRLQDCKAGPCRNCNMHGHHTSICRYQHPPTELKPRKGEEITNFKTRTPTKLPNTTPKEKKPISSKTNTVISDKTQHGETVVLHTMKEHTSNGQILAGKAKALNPSNTEEELIEVIFDTGSDRSFISNALATRLKLQDSDSIELNIHTFGDPKPIKKTCGITTLKLQDAYGSEHEIGATRIDTITEPLERLGLSREDRESLHNHRIKLSINPDSTIINPQLLLGCADLFSLLDNELVPNKTLPSGMKLVHSKLGYLVTGGIRNQPNISDDDMCSTNKEMQGQIVYSVTEHQSWEDFWTFESSGVHEFSGPNKEEKQQQNTSIWKQFQKR